MTLNQFVGMKLFHGPVTFEDFSLFSCCYLENPLEIISANVKSKVVYVNFDYFVC